MARESLDIPHSMRKVCRRFERWRSAHTHAEAAIEAILRSAPSSEITQQLQELVAGKPRLARAFAAATPATARK